MLLYSIHKIANATCRNDFRVHAPRECAIEAALQSRAQYLECGTGSCIGRAAEETVG